MKINTDKQFYKWEVVLLLWLAFFLNQGDRQAFNVVLPQIQDHLGASDATMGLIARHVCFDKDVAKMSSNL